MEQDAKPYPSYPDPDRLPWDSATPEQVLQDIREFKDNLKNHPERLMDPNLDSTFPDVLTSYSSEFDEKTIERHRMGGEKYGPGKFLTVDTLEEALDELVDLANYARYTFIKLRLLQETIARVGAETETVTPDGFVKTSDFIKLKETNK